MRVRLLAVGTRMPAWVEEGVETYRKRLPRDFALTVEEIAPGQRGKNADTARAIATEAERLRARLRGDEHLITTQIKQKVGSLHHFTRLFHKHSTLKL